jgi:hypothetical protein
MEIKLPTSCRAYPTNYPPWVVVVVLTIILVLGNGSHIEAEPFMRVCKQGVVYYYFSNKQNLTSVRTFGNRTDNQKQSLRPLGRQKVAAAALEPCIQLAGRNHKLPPALIKAVIRVESNFNPEATSPKGAQGLMQLMPGTAADLQVSNPYDIQENILGGSRYLGMLLQKFNYNLPLALAAYNAGPGRVERCQGVPRIQETQRFVRDVCTGFLEYSGKAKEPE